ncbi:MAG: hypothetical protein RMJ55_08050 [Roseiflexaceae bacterium]|nr:hypothetical protein [Roseiflexus sp.]MDW8213493.1 hypothetical protein [Roseiflexaceae bacterium]
MATYHITGEYERLLDVDDNSVSPGPAREGGLRNRSPRLQAPGELVHAPGVAPIVGANNAMADEAALFSCAADRS